MAYYVYIMTNENKTLHYTGMTPNLAKKVQEHRIDKSGFFGRNNINKLVYYEKHEFLNEAKRREDSIKGWDVGYFKNIMNIQNKNYEDLFSRLLREIQQDKKHGK